MLERCVPWTAGGEKVAVTSPGNNSELPRPDVSTLPPPRLENSPFRGRAAAATRPTTPLRLVSPPIAPAATVTTQPRLSFARVRTPLMRQSPAPPNLTSYTVNACEASTIRHLPPRPTVSPSTAPSASPYSGPALRDSRVHVLAGSSVIPVTQSVTYGNGSRPPALSVAAEPLLIGRQQSQQQQQQSKPVTKRVREWSAELCNIRRKQLELAREENAVLQQELDRCRAALQEKEERLKSVEHSLDLFGDILVMWLQTLSELESKKVLSTLMSLLVTTDAARELDKKLATAAIPPTTETPDLHAHTQNDSTEHQPTTESVKPVEKENSLVKEKLERASAELEKRSSGRSASAAAAGPPPLPPAVPPKKSASLTMKVPPLRLDSVGSGMWMGGRQTAGEVYAE